MLKRASCGVPWDTKKVRWSGANRWLYGRALTQLVVVAEADGAIAESSASVFVLPSAPLVLAPPAGTLDGINHVDESTVILQWTAPYKDFVFAVGDFNDWFIGSESMMHDAGDGEISLDA